MSKKTDNRNCHGCDSFLTNPDLKNLNSKYGDEVFPLDVSWKNCLHGPDHYLNCRRRLKGGE